MYEEREVSSLRFKNCALYDIECHGTISALEQKYQALLCPASVRLDRPRTLFGLSHKPGDTDRLS